MNKTVLACMFAAALSLPQIGNAQDGPFLGNGFKVGEAGHDSVIIWARATKQRSADFQRLAIFTEGLPSNERSNLAMPVGIHPGAPGEVQVSYWLSEDKDTRKQTKWTPVDSKADYCCQIALKGLQPGASYLCEVAVRAPGGSKPSHRLSGKFHTAPKSDSEKPIRFIVSTCQAIRSIDSGKDGHIAYLQMLDFKPHFFVHTGDILYYDKVPLSKNEEQARAKWNLMFGYRFNREFHQQVSSYFMKDDHDTLKNDCWPGQKYGELTFDQGLKIFREQVCMGKKTYRTIRWGKHVQIWMTENRDFRSSNRIKDGPEKTILGKEQKTWLKKTIRESDATFKFVISPGPIVGPDKKGKADNHSNANFAFEGQELRDFLSAQKNTYVICGDRHWQYCSKDPKTKLFEFGCGPINDEHRFGGNPGNKPEYHRYFSGKGGFMGVTVQKGKAKVDWYALQGTADKPEKPKIRHSESFVAE